MKCQIRLSTLLFTALLSPLCIAEDYVLSASWQPAFCESHRNKTECSRQTSSDYSARNFTLHGLWPQSGEYCGVTGHDKMLDQQNHWDQLPSITLSPSLMTDLQTKMPGALSHLERHEWTKHGVCSNLDQEVYFSTALALLDKLNATPLADLVRTSAGNNVDTADLKNRISQTYGAAKLPDVELLCESHAGKQLLTEIRFNFTSSPDKIDITEASLSTPRRPSNKPCQSGKVYIDPAGFDQH